MNNCLDFGGDGMVRLQFRGRPHNSKSYQRILIKFSGNVVEKVSEQLIRFWRWWQDYSLWSAHITQKFMNGFFMKFSGNVQKGSRNKWLDFEVAGMARLQFIGSSQNWKSYEWILMKLSGNVQKGSRNKWIDFGGDGLLFIYLFVCLSVCLLVC